MGLINFLNAQREALIEATWDKLKLVTFTKQVMHHGYLSYLWAASILALSRILSAYKPQPCQSSRLTWLKGCS